MKRLLAVAALVLAGCSTSRPLMEPPDQIQSFCADKKVPKRTAIASIVSSVGDRIETSFAFPSPSALLTDVKQNTGVIGHWKSQPLYMPNTAKALGIPGDYIDLTGVVIDNQLSGSQTRLIYATISTPSGPKHLVLRAYDVQDVCVEGESLM